MAVITVTEDKIRSMKGMEGLVLQGCGGNLEEWVDGINSELTENGILKDGSVFEKVYAFQHDGISCILYPFEGTALDMGKLAVWRIRTREIFGGAWLSDYVPNCLGGFTALELILRLWGEHLKGKGRGAFCQDVSYLHRSRSFVLYLL